MKTPILKSIVMVTVTSLAVMSCNNSPKAKEQELENAMEEVVVAKDELDESTTDSIYDFKKFKESIELKLIENEKVIADLKARNNSSDKATKASFEKELRKLEIRNEQLVAKIDNYKQGPAQKWELFKVDFNRDLDDLGKSISTMAEQNMKK